MSFIRKKLKIWKDLKRSRKLSLVMKFFLIASGIFLSTIGILASTSLYLVLQNIDIPEDIPEMKLDFSNYTKIKDTYVKIPYRVSNKGVFTINDIRMRVQIEIKYFDKFSTHSTFNTIFSKKEQLGGCLSGKHLVGDFEGDYRDLNTTALGIYLINVDPTKNQSYYLSVELWASLSGLLMFNFKLSYKII
jgi:hypothetical protein